jgi:hypothetical protein
MHDDGLHPYYREHKARILREFRESLRLARPHFDALLPDQPLEALEPALLEAFEQVFPTLPYVGGADGRMTPFFEQGAGVLALGRVLRARSVAVPVIATLIRKTFVARLASLPEVERRALGERFLSAENQAFLREQAKASQERADPHDFVYRFVEAGHTPEGEPFGFGIDYTECGFCKLCRRNGDEDLLPHLCALDGEYYALRGIDLKRSTTIAGGDGRCNFRFRAMPAVTASPASSAPAAPGESPVRPPA